jgi:ATP-dependent DNA ligase
MSVGDLPVAPPVKPMLAKATKTMPTDPGLLYEPKWDGFRCIAFCADDDVELGSRNQRPFNRYFPEILEPLRESLPERCVVDGELVVAGPSGLDFDALQQRIHPAESRVRRLAAETPASFVAFDLLALGDRDLRGEQLAIRRTLLEEAVRQAAPPVHLTPTTTDPVVAQDWFTRFEGAGLDGVVAKPLDGVYQEDARGWIKVKHERTADCVVAGFRRHKDGEGVGSLLIGLHDETGHLHHIGVATSFTAQRRRELVEELEPLREGALDGHPWAHWRDEEAHVGGDTRMPGSPSRWTGGRNLEWEALRPEWVCEISFTQLQGRRLRHSGKFLRWRFDKDPADCTYDQLDVAVPMEFSTVFGA